MITLYSGTPGSGKSLHIAKDIRDRAYLGKPTIANFPAELSRYKRANYTYCPNDELTPEYLEAYSREYFKNHKFKEGAILLVIDECQLLFNAREWQQTGRAQWLSFFTQHRKFGYNIVLIAQFDRMIDRQIRSLIEYEYIHRKASNYGVGGIIFSLCSGGNLFIAVHMWYPLKAKIGSEFFHARKKYWSIYDSYATFGAAEGASGGVGAPESTSDATETQRTVERKKNFYFVAFAGKVFHRASSFIQDVLRRIWSLLPRRDKNDITFNQVYPDFCTVYWDGAYVGDVRVEAGGWQFRTAGNPCYISPICGSRIEAVRSWGVFD